MREKRATDETYPEGDARRVNTKPKRKKPKRAKTKRAKTNRTKRSPIDLGVRIRPTDIALGWSPAARRIPRIRSEAIPDERLRYFRDC